ncbi:MAG: O-methyltransferase [Crocinitomicaceae bacterium]|nr:O-methyltransferase [Crocinitomicaceae bacterium]MBK8924607.1 O-methyltransferase [Crocinitomicaceae bacterium]
MDFLSREISDYCEQHTSPEDELLNNLRRETHLHVMSPRMISGHLQGRILSAISQLLKPQSILEIGTYTGYSAICLSEGLAENGKLITIDYNPEFKPIHQKYLLQSARANQIEIIYDKATSVIPLLTGPFDLVFIDADKENYAVYFDLVIDKMRSGGVILADNVLWSGKVVEPIKPNDKSTAALAAFNEKIMQDKRVSKVLLPIRDGIFFIRKL